MEQSVAAEVMSAFDENDMNIRISHLVQTHLSIDLQCAAVYTLNSSTHTV